MINAESVHPWEGVEFEVVETIVLVAGLAVVGRFIDSQTVSEKLLPFRTATPLQLERNTKRGQISACLTGKYRCVCT